MDSVTFLCSMFRPGYAKTFDTGLYLVSVKDYNCSLGMAHQSLSKAFATPRSRLEMKKLCFCQFVAGNSRCPALGRTMPF